MTTKTAVIAGASGLIGRRIAEQLLAQGGWNVVGLARRPPASGDMRWIGVDLNDADDCRGKLASLTNATHIFYAARYDHPEGMPESVEINAAMLKNLVSVLESIAKLQHVHAVHGSKYYGHQLGPVPIPLTEEAPRAKNRNFYFEQEDFLRELSRGKAWTYTTSRPHAFCDPAIDHPRSIGLVIAVYAMVQRELGFALDFPGTQTGFSVHTQFTDLRLLARCVAWMAQEPRCANQGFNVVNGDYPRWSDLWPQFAAGFGLTTGSPRNLKMAEYMSDKADVWQRVIKKHALRPTSLESIALWAYGDYQFRPEWDIKSTMTKARSLGFTDALDSGAMFAQHFDHYRSEKITA